MNGFLHKIWVVLFAFMIFGLLALVPVDKYQKAYMDEYHRIKSKPQRHIDANYKYVDYIEDGGSPEAVDLFFKDSKINYKKRYSRPRNKRRKPYYRRDKYNPNILYPYKG